MNTKTSLALAAACSFLLPPLAISQTKPPEQTRQKTTLELLQKRIGVVLVKGSSRIGTVKGDGGDVQVSAIEYLDTATGEKTRGIEFFLIAKSGSHPQIDYDEIEPLLKGIDRLVTLDKGITELGQFEAVYRTKTNMTISLVASPFGKDLTTVLDANTLGGGIVFVGLEGLKELGRLIKEAKTKLDSLKPTK